MSRAQKLRGFVSQRLNAAVEEIMGVFEKTISKYEQEAALSQEVISRQHALLCALLKPQSQLTADAFTKQLLVSKEQSGVEQEEPEPPQVKEEQEEPWSSQEGEQLDIIKFTYRSSYVESRDEDWTEASPLHQTLNIKRHPTEPGTSTQQMKPESDGEDCAESEPARNLDPAVSDAQLVSSHSSGTETEDSDDYSKDSADPLSGLITLKAKKKRRKTGSFACKVCGRSFQAKGFLMMHVSVHADDPESVCGLCGERFDTANSLKLHLQTHRKNKGKCDICGRDFPSRQGLENHMRTHTGERPFGCHICFKRFHQRSHLATHIKLHTGEKPHRCGECGKSFIQLSNKRRHKCHPRMMSERVNRPHRLLRPAETAQ